MKKTLRKLLFFLQILFVSPLIIPFWLTDCQGIVITDLKRWVELLSREDRSTAIQLLDLLASAKEFRNLYYHRLFKGNWQGRLAMYCCRLIYREFPYFFLDSSCNIGAGLFVQHGFSTIVMADLGENCWINQQVTIGHKDKSGRPRLGNHVRITAGAKVLGNIQIGDNVTVGANAVVVKNVPDNCVVVGVPAYIVKKDGVKVYEKL
jgi:serine O-acetyltransferase